MPPPVILTIELQKGFKGIQDFTMNHCHQVQALNSKLIQPSLKNNVGCVFEEGDSSKNMNEFENN